LCFFSDDTLLADKRFATAAVIDDDFGVDVDVDAFCDTLFVFFFLRDVTGVCAREFTREDTLDDTRDDRRDDTLEETLDDAADAALEEATDSALDSDACVRENSVDSPLPLPRRRRRERGIEPSVCFIATAIGADDADDVTSVVDVFVIIVDVGDVDFFADGVVGSRRFILIGFLTALFFFLRAGDDADVTDADADVDDADNDEDEDDDDDDDDEDDDDEDDDDDEEDVNAAAAASAANFRFFTDADSFFKWSVVCKIEY
jgi:hypothetical protein